MFAKKMDSNVLVYINIDCPDDRYPKLIIDISKLTLAGYEFIPIEYATMYCVI
jgi:hypothetical protein